MWMGSNILPDSENELLAIARQESDRQYFVECVMYNMYLFKCLVLSGRLVVMFPDGDATKRRETFRS